MTTVKMQAWYAPVQAKYVTAFLPVTQVVATFWKHLETSELVENVASIAEPALETQITVLPVLKICFSTRRKQETRLTTAHHFAWTAIFPILSRNAACHVINNALAVKAAPTTAPCVMLRNSLTSPAV